MGETPLTLTFHGINIVLNVALLGVLLKLGKPMLHEYKIWIRAKERLNILWKHHNPADYIPLENGSK